MAISGPYTGWTWEKFVPFAKWWFNLLRSFFVVALLAFFAHQSKNTYLIGLSWFSTLIFILYVASYLWELFVPQIIEINKMKNRRLSWMLWIIVVGIASYGNWRWSGVIFDALNDVVKAQIPPIHPPLPPLNE